MKVPRVWDINEMASYWAKEYFYNKTKNISKKDANNLHITTNCGNIQQELQESGYGNFSAEPMSCCFTGGSGTHICTAINSIKMDGQVVDTHRGMTPHLLILSGSVNINITYKDLKYKESNTIAEILHFYFSTKIFPEEGGSAPENHGFVVDRTRNKVVFNPTGSLKRLDKGGTANSEIIEDGTGTDDSYRTRLDKEGTANSEFIEDGKGTDDAYRTSNTNGKACRNCYVDGSSSDADDTDAADDVNSTRYNVFLGFDFGQPWFTSEILFISFISVMLFGLLYSSV